MEPRPGVAGPNPVHPQNPSGASVPATAAGPVCEVCGTVMFERHCKILCPRCGYQRDCSDP